MTYPTPAMTALCSTLVCSLAMAQDFSLQVLREPRAIHAEWEMPSTEYRQAHLQGTRWFGDSHCIAVYIHTAYTCLL
jgi:hypothetical protein